MTFTSYAQNYEDVLLWRALCDVNNGRYLDIGAQDPVVDSVSLAFYEAGWRGIHVDPSPAYANLLRDNRPDETVIEAAVTDAIGPLEFYEIPNTGLSTGKRVVADRHAEAGFERRKLLVPTVRLDSLLETGEREFNWMKIDVEGMEAEVLRSWGDCPCRPWVLVIESTSPGREEHTWQQWIEEVLSRDYSQVLFDGLSTYFVHKSHHELAERFSAPANVFDRFAVAIHHFSAGLIRGELQATHQRLDEEWARAEQHRSELGLTLHARDAALDEAALLREQLLAEQERHESELSTERDLRNQADARGDLLLENLRRAEATSASTRVELARFEERSAQLQDKLERTDAQLVEKQHELARLRADVDGLEAAIRAVAAERPGLWQRVGEKIGFAPRSEALQSLVKRSGSPLPKSQLDATSTRPESEGTVNSMHQPETDEARNPYLRANSLAELLSWHDLDFVRCAYVTVLGRQPDPRGEEYYVGRLRRGYSKLGILWQLRKSEEGPEHDPGIAGFDKALRKHRNARIPVLGLLISSVTGRESDSRLERRLRAIENLVGARPKPVPVVTWGGATIEQQLIAELSKMTQAVQNALLAQSRLGSELSVPADYGSVRGRLSPRAQSVFDKVYQVSDPSSAIGRLQ